MHTENFYTVQTCYRNSVVVYYTNIVLIDFSTKTFQELNLNLNKQVDLQQAATVFVTFTVV